MEVRRARDDEVDVVAELRLAFIADHRGIDPAALDPGYADATRAWVRARTEAGRLASWLALDGGAPATPVGIASVVLADVPPRPDDPRALEGYVINMYVVPTARRRGVARALLAAAEAGAGDLGVRATYLYATPDGRHLYEDVGYAPDPTWMRRMLP
ncbi:MAG: GNAT family N-acetyltransferase [Acidimicrobiales bacterium]